MGVGGKEMKRAVEVGVKKRKGANESWLQGKERGKEKSEKPNREIMPPKGRSRFFWSVVILGFNKNPTKSKVNSAALRAHTTNFTKF